MNEVLRRLDKLEADSGDGKASLVQRQSPSLHNTKHLQNNTTQQFKLPADEKQEGQVNHNQIQVKNSNSFFGF